MPLINSPTLIRAFALLHLTTAYYLLTNPSTVANHHFVALMAAAMGLPPPSPLTSTLAASPAYALASCFLAFLCITDLAGTSLSPEIYSHYWSSQAPFRLLFFFALTAWSYMGKPGGLLALGGGGLSEGLVFTWAFVEMVWWFWIYVTLRDERREVLMRRMERKRAEEERRL